MAILQFPNKAAEPRATYQVTIELDDVGDVMGVKAPDVGGRDARAIIAQHLREAASLLENGAANDG